MTIADTAPDFDVHRISGTTGARLSGIDLTRVLTSETVTALVDHLDEHGVVVIRGQDFDAASHLALARALGDVEPPPDYFPETLAASGFPEIGVISTENGLAYLTDQWHSDVTWRERPPRYTLLRVHQLPDAGGDTMWSNLYAAYEALSEPVKRFIDPLTAEHQLPGTPERATSHPVVTRNERTGRPALYVNQVFTTRINELATRESRAVLDMLFEQSIRPEFVCRWAWQVGDLAVWDNHFVQHYAVADYTGPRKISRIEVLADPIHAHHR